MSATEDDAAETSGDDFDAIRPEIEHLSVPIDSLTPYPGNARIGNLTVIGRSLRKNGQYKPVLIQQRTGYVIAGNHLWKAAKQERGWTEIAAQPLDLDDDSARRIALADNRSSDLSSYDKRLLAELLGEAPDLDGTGYDPGDLDDLLKQLEPPDLDDLAEEIGDPQAEDGYDSIRIRAPRHVIAAWKSHVDTHSGDEVEALSALLGIDAELPEEFAE